MPYPSYSPELAHVILWLNQIIKSCMRGQLGDSCTHNFHLGRYIVGYTVRNLVLYPTIKLPKEKFWIWLSPFYCTINIFLSKRQWKCSLLRLRPAAASCIKPLASCIYSLVNQWKATLHNDFGFETVYCLKFMTLTNQTSCCVCKCIRNCTTPSAVHFPVPINYMYTQRGLP